MMVLITVSKLRIKMIRHIKEGKSVWTHLMNARVTARRKPSKRVLLIRMNKTIREKVRRNQDRLRGGHSRKQTQTPSISCSSWHHTLKRSLTIFSPDAAVEASRRMARTWSNCIKWHLPRQSLTSLRQMNTIKIWRCLLFSLVMKTLTDYISNHAISSWSKTLFKEATIELL